jgi:tRNA dimethylallyltransferase
MSKGYNRALASMSGIGYKEMYAYIEGEISLEEAIRLIKRKTRIFVRRQANWFSENDPTIQWFDAETLKIEDLVNYIYRDEGWLLPNK